MSKNDLIRRQNAKIFGYKQAVKQTYVQFMVDMFQLSLNDPEVMGKDTLGYARQKKVIDSVIANYDKFHGVLERNVETDYLREKLEEYLKNINGENHHPFLIRYPLLEDIRTVKQR